MQGIVADSLHYVTCFVPLFLTLLLYFLLPILTELAQAYELPLAEPGPVPKVAGPGSTHVWTNATSTLLANLDSCIWALFFVEHDNRRLQHMEILQHLTKVKTKSEEWSAIICASHIDEGFSSHSFFFHLKITLVLLSVGNKYHIRNAFLLTKSLHKI